MFCSNINSNPLTTFWALTSSVVFIASSMSFIIDVYKLLTNEEPAFYRCSSIDSTD